MSWNSATQSPQITLSRNLFIKVSRSFLDLLLLVSRLSINHHNIISQKVTRYLEKSPSPPTCNPLQEQVILLQLNFSTFPPLLPVQKQPSSLTYQIFRIYYPCFTPAPPHYHQNDLFRMPSDMCTAFPFKPL